MDTIIERKINFAPYLWGKHGWIFFNHVALSYPQNPTDEEKRAYKSFFTEVQHILPCLSCSINYKKHLKELPIDNFLGSSDDLFSWTIKMQNKVNEHLKKPLLDEDYIKSIHMNPPRPLNPKIKIILFLFGSIGLFFLIKKILNIKKINIIYH